MATSDQRRRTFGVADIRTLARNPGAALEPPDGRGYGYPEQAWLYRSVESYYRAGRRPNMLWQTLESLVSGGSANAIWRDQKVARLREHLRTFLRLDQSAAGIFVDSAFRRPARRADWSGHLLRLPLGIIFATSEGRVMRLLWPEKEHGPRSRGIFLLAAATLATAERTGFDLGRLETWHLRDGEVGSYPARDLHTAFGRLDRLLEAAERPASQPPAA
jgi:hypothetical protein